ncbi:putative pol polyprotein [Penicillium digitatum]|uniref:Putative pol polyprotein n=1 Tax=Penicillium digitatum TaxID=36651 RepID=A0A7T6XT45_PENDI|nr:putative pol polyprotein [Penicillium digitatum]
MLEQAINRELKGMLLHHEPPKGDYLDLARFLQNLENRRVQYDSGPSTAPRTYSAAIRTAPKAPELNSGRPGPEQTATTPPVNPDAMDLSAIRRRYEQPLRRRGDPPF